MAAAVTGDSIEKVVLKLKTKELFDFVPVFSPSVFDSVPELSPNGRFFLFSSDKTAYSLDLRTLKLDRREARRSLFPAETEYSSGWLQGGFVGVTGSQVFVDLGSGKASLFRVLREPQQRSLEVAAYGPPCKTAKYLAG